MKGLKLSNFTDIKLYKIKQYKLWLVVSNIRNFSYTLTFSSFGISRNKLKTLRNVEEFFLHCSDSEGTRTEFLNFLRPRKELGRNLKKRNGTRNKNFLFRTVSTNISPPLPHPLCCIFHQPLLLEKLVINPILGKELRVVYRQSRKLFVFL